MNKDNKLSLKNIARKITTAKIVIVIGIILFLGLAFFSVIDGIVSITDGFLAEIKGTVTELVNGIFKPDVVAGMDTYVISDTQVNNLKEKLEGVGIDTEVCGLTEIRLRKIVLAYGVSTSFDYTLCSAPVTEEQIVANINEKEYGKDFTQIDDFTSYCDSNGKTKESKTVWPIDNPNYKLYYDSDKFFYFKDTSDILGSGAEQWYLGAMGATSISAEDGSEMTYVDATVFQDLLDDYNTFVSANSDDPEKILKSDERKNLLSVFTSGSEKGSIKVYKIESYVRQYNYQFKNKNITDINLSDVDETTDFHAYPQEESIEDKVDMSNYAISIELMIDLLNMSGSGEFLENFIDYALEKTDASVKVYTTTTKNYSYSKKEYNIDEDFILEMYDINDVGIADWAIEWGDDNFKAYKSIIYNRQFTRPFTRVNELFKDTVGNTVTIDYSGQVDEYGNTYSVPELNKILKTAYEPGNIDLGTISVSESITEITESNGWEFAPSQINTWYGTIGFSEPTIDDNYIIPTISGEGTETEYNDYDYTDLTDYTTSTGTRVKRAYISDELNIQSPISRADVENEIVDSSDIYNNVLSMDPGEDNESNYWYWTINGLAKIAQSDNGDYDIDIGAGTGCDYIYVEYTTENVKEYETRRKSYMQTLNTSNVKKSSSNIDSELKKFLILLKNQTGNIPTLPIDETTEGGFSKDGKVVMYGDIYKGHIPAGDLLLDNGALMLFELLESSPNTQGLVNVFKYLAYLYTGTDHGVTLDDLTSIFSFSSVTTIYGTSVEEKVWYALKQCGFSDEAVAGVMGNLYAESGFKTNNLEGSFESVLGYTDESYTAAINNGTYTRQQFISDHTSSNCGAGYGLAQWTYKTRKAGLYDYCKDKGVSIDDVDAQIEYLIAEITGTGPAAGYADVQINGTHKGYSRSDWENAKTVEDATIAFCYIFEKPSIPHMEKRKVAAKSYLEQYKGKTMPETGSYNGTFLQIAEQCHEYLRINNYYYSSAKHKTDEAV